MTLHLKKCQKNLLNGKKNKKPTHLLNVVVTCKDLTKLLGYWLFSVHCFTPTAVTGTSSLSRPPTGSRGAVQVMEGAQHTGRQGQMAV